MRFISTLLLLITLSACNLAGAPVVTEEIVIGATTIVTTTPLPPVTTAPSATPLPTGVPVEQVSTGCTIPDGWVTYTVQSGDTLFSIAQRANSSVDALVEANCLASANVLNTGQILYLPEAISVRANDNSSETISYWLASESPESGISIEVGCGTYLTQFDTGTTRSPSPNNNISTGLDALFNSPHTGYRNHWQGFTVGSVGVDGNGIAHVIINGDFLLEGACSDPEIVGQILMVVFSEPAVQSAIITVDGMNLAQISDMSGRSGADARFTRASLP